MATPTLNTRPKAWVWLGFPGQSIDALTLTGWPSSLNGETVTFIYNPIDGAEVDTTIVDGVATFPSFTLPDEPDTYITHLFIGDNVDQFARGRLSIQESGTSSFTATSFDVNVLGITFELAVTVTGATAAQAAAIAAAQADADAAQAAIAAHEADASGAHAGTAIAVAVPGITATEASAALLELLTEQAATAAEVNALLTPGSGLGTYAREAAGVDYRDRSSRFRYGGILVASTTAATSLLASPLTIPANTLTAFVPGVPADASACIMSANGAVTNTTGSSRTMTYIVTITQGANVVVWTLPVTVPNGTSSAPWILDLDWILFNVSGFVAPHGAAELRGNGLTSVIAASAPGFSNFDITQPWTVNLTATPSFSSASLATTSTRAMEMRYHRTIHT